MRDRSGQALTLRLFRGRAWTTIRSEAPYQGRGAANLRAIVDDLRSQGFTSVRAIAAQLNELGILTARGGSWHPMLAARLLWRLQAAYLSRVTAKELIAAVSLLMPPVLPEIPPAHGFDKRQ